MDVGNDASLQTGEESNSQRRADERRVTPDTAEFSGRNGEYEIGDKGDSPELSRILDRFGNAVFRGALTGLSLRGGLLGVR